MNGIDAILIGIGIVYVVVVIGVVYGYIVEARKDRDIE